jgi:hypothetical protein
MLKTALSFLTGLPIKVKLYAAAVVIAAAAFAGFIHHERTLGAQKVLLAQSVEREKVAVKARVAYEHQADSLLKVQRHTDSVSKASAASFSSASDAHAAASANFHASVRTLVITDTTAVRAALRKAEISDSTARVADSTAKKALADKDKTIGVRDERILNLLAQISSDSTIENALRAQNSILAREIPGAPSKLGGMLKLAATAVLAFEAGKHL